MANLRYSEKMLAFNARFNAHQRNKLSAVAKKLGVKDAEALRVILEKYGN